MRIFKSVVTAQLSGMERMTYDVCGTIETIEMFLDLVRQAYKLPIRDVKCKTELLGSIKDVD